jgi:tRNA(fMet)-specific endonuclease VapC
MTPAYLLDTNAVIALINQPDSPVERRLRQHAPQDVAISALVVHELYYGAYKSQRRDYNLARLERLRFSVLELDAEDAKASGRIRAALAAQGTPIGAYDVLIAGQALARNLTLVTHNLAEFHRVEGLRIEDWLT